MIVEMEEEDGKLTVTVSFSEDSETGQKVNTDVVREKVYKAGYDFTQYLTTDAIVDEPGQAVEGTWAFELPTTDEEEPLTLSMLRKIKGIGKTTAEKILNKHDKESLEESLKKRDLDVKGVTSSTIEEMRDKFIG